MVSNGFLKGISVVETFKDFLTIKGLFFRLRLHKLVEISGLASLYRPDILFYQFVSVIDVQLLQIGRQFSLSCVVIISRVHDLFKVIIKLINKYECRQ